MTGDRDLPPPLCCAVLPPAWRGGSNHSPAVSRMVAVAKPVGLKEVM